jgi:hypothetical protein
MEKNVMRSLETVAKERMEVAVCALPCLFPPVLELAKLTTGQQQLSLWGESCDEDVSDVTDKLGVLLYEIGELEDQYVDRYDQYRVTIKSIRNIEASVQPSRDSAYSLMTLSVLTTRNTLSLTAPGKQESKRSLTRLRSSSTRSPTPPGSSSSSRSSSAPKPSRSWPRPSSPT